VSPTTARAEPVEFLADRAADRSTAAAHDGRTAFKGQSTTYLGFLASSISMRMIMMLAPLRGVRVLELGTALAGPWCGHVLAVLGSDVIKVEPLTGDEARSGGSPLWNGESPLFLAANANKRSIAVDLRSQEARSIVFRLAERVDIVLQNLRPGTVERLGFGFDELRERNPRVVYCNIGGFGHKGPLRDAAAYDAVIQGVTGIMSNTRESSDHPPLRTGPAIVDLGTGLWAAIGILAALRARDVYGTAQRVDTSLFETGVNWQPMQMLSYLADGVVQPPPGRASLIYAPFQSFDTSDGAIVIGAGNDRLFRELVEVLEAPELLDDPRFASNVERVRHRGALAERLAERFATDTTAAWLIRLRGAGLPAGCVQDIGELADDPQLEALGLLEPIEHPAIPGLQLVAPPLSFNGDRPGFRRPPPLLSQHADEVLKELGLEPEDIARLEHDGIVGSAGRVLDGA
jgi:crotonobetainyl-CoA:carnitine CoA-transferase CaiB-like acyl-CoA transferase